MSGPTVLAAGGVLWCGKPGDPEVALVHRPKYDDWSLPKGKAEPGEHVIATALREVAEETGYRARLGPYLTTLQYRVTSAGSSSNKSVSYWSMKSADGSFQASDEVDAMQWLPLDQAQDRLDAKSDRSVLDAFMRTRKDTKLLVLLRHGESATASHRGSLVPVLEMLGVTDLLSADEFSSVDMLTPLAEVTGLRVQREAQLTRAGFVGNEMQVVDRVRSYAFSSEALVVCAGKRVVAGLLGALGRNSEAMGPAEMTVKKGGMWLLHHCDGAVSAYEKHEL